MVHNGRKSTVLKQLSNYALENIENTFNNVADVRSDLELQKL